MKVKAGFEPKRWPFWAVIMIVFLVPVSKYWREKREIIMLPQKYTVFLSRKKQERNEMKERKREASFFSLVLCMLRKYISS